MAATVSSTGGVRSLWLLLWLGLTLGFGLGDSLAAALKVPFRVKDVLPILPHQISWPVMNNLHTAIDLLPSFVGSVVPDAGIVGWKGACFFENEARLEFTEHVSGGGNESSLNGGILHLKANSCYFVFFC
ncbi:hypothetical protein B296_00033082 [Ensete ventricosum]|uniref:Uncharacterized protein n=1 Tax=Ensete ventricosum TaxID=4639 RepID=A0A426XIC7_ENSVE|nr:hypothetical protein B296_00033082 [Ensete ventricosum]